MILFYEQILLTDDEYGEKTVSVSLDGQEAELNFIDHPSNEMGVSVDVDMFMWLKIADM